MTGMRRWWLIGVVALAFVFLILLAVARPARRTTVLPAGLPPAEVLPACSEPRVPGGRLALDGVKSTFRVALRAGQESAAASTLMSPEFLIAHRGVVANVEPDSCNAVLVKFYLDPAAEGVGKTLREVRAVPGVIDVVLVS